MADESKFQKIDKKNQLFKKQRSQLDMGQEKIKCLCDHQKKGQPTLVKRNGNLYTCKQCDKDNINLSSNVTDQKKIAEAIEVIDNALDIIKMNLRTDVEEDRKILGKISKTQFFLRYWLLKLMESLTKRNKKRDKKTREDSGWGKSRVIE